jgi:hypothetical protein
MNLGAIWGKLNSIDRRLIYNLFIPHINIQKNTIIFLDIYDVCVTLEKNVESLRKERVREFTWCQNELKRSKKIIKLIRKVS